ncbi:LAMI_0G10858g1_1 [Lachancea mirantina]|uniref:LAMI_0G10858g1_1 n=1 Tax=Lachancea mirantina TaxID=1230905 RepID=A0A1G4KAV0_9SACH|nr:LAMI_0G10858g1_1 [Lachancea mirantina]
MVHVMTNSLLESRYTYHSILSDVCKTRFNHLATRLLVSASFSLGLISAIFCQTCGSKWEYMIVIPFRALLIYLASLLVIITRKNYLHVQYFGYTSILTQFYGQLCSIKAAAYALIYFFSGLNISHVLHGCFFGITDVESSSLYKFGMWVLVPLFYAAQHAIFDMDRLSFRHGSQHQHPLRYISGKVKKSSMKCGVLSAIIFFCLPLCSIYILSSGAPSLFMNFKLTCLSFAIFSIWEFINVAFDGYLSVGCLHRGKPLSSFSSTPMEALVTGLSSPKLFTKLTAFQELSYRATSPDLELRVPLYRTRFRNTSVWPSILKECLLTVQASNASVSHFMKNVDTRQERLKRAETEKIDDVHIDPNTEVLFGNKHVISTGLSTKLPGSHGMPEGLNHRIKLQNNEVFLGQDHTPSSRPFRISPAPRNSLLTEKTALLVILNDISSYFKQLVTTFFAPGQAEDSAPQISFFDLWRISKRKQAEKLVPLPVCYAECLIALMGLLINALEEDPKGSVVSSVGEVLKLLERSVGALGAYAEWEEPSVANEASLPDAVTILYDLSINAFLEVVLRYNDLLNSVYLDEDVVKLSKWVLEIYNEKACMI